MQKGVSQFESIKLVYLKKLPIWLQNKAWQNV
jgi:hypothetical protein